MIDSMIPKTRNNTSNLSRRSSDPTSILDSLFKDPFDGWTGTGYDVIEHEDSYEYQFDFPGLSKDDVEITLDQNGRLNISSTVETEESDDNFVHKGRKTRNYVIGAGRSVDPEDITAKMDKGVLKLQIPKQGSKQSTGYEIEIE